MKTLKNESAIYLEQIVSAIGACYKTTAEPSNAELMELYGFIGQCVCEQGEKAFIAHLAQALGLQLPQHKGFSPRNLRRMRDFYRAYENSPLLMKQALSLNWTQNAVILECCETNEQRAFYIRLAAEQNLSKLALLKAMESGAFETDSTAQTTATDVTNACAPVSDSSKAQAIDAASDKQEPCGAFVTACEPPRQGDGISQCGKAAKGMNMGQWKWLLPPILSGLAKKARELLPDRLDHARIGNRQIRPKKHQPANASPPPRWRDDFRILQRKRCFA